MTTELMLRYGVALAIGLLVGLERGWRERSEPAGHRIAGIRTYSITGLLGACLGSLTTITGSAMPLVASILVYGALFGALEYRKAVAEKEYSVTGFVAALVVMMLGVLAVVGDFRLAAAGGVALAGLLASRDMLHSLLQRITWAEIRSAIVLAAMSAIVLPLLPDRTIDPWGGFNPREIWLFTVLTAALSYLGYVAVRIVGPSRGALITGLTGGLVSSTSVTVAFARTAAGGGANWPLVAGACTAAMVSVIRVSVIVFLLRPEILQTIGPAAAAAALTLGLAALLLVTFQKEEPGDEGLPARNPFDLGHLLIFAAGFALVSTVSAAFVGNFGASSLIASSTLSGMFDVDIAVLSALRLDGTTVQAVQVGEAILCALAANGIGRLSLAVAAGPARFFLPLGGATLLAAVAGLVVFLLLAP
ncbi:MgtC/SapB family protein [Gellertiella hungarica]|uniref:Uncharacterized membrane protein (DUF4010 family) n=1 Tax=Gellertiella hungarica TaxID=1572859 RepID=A0A7W6J709_9HYPH|nr:DUF4010 domain-containing protein [Gellertiella hungarica]MBB4065985.1 uncharacterized membrane protein (DUF4010 family) [Gellertiella hungarica]